MILVQLLTVALVLMLSSVSARADVSIKKLFRLDQARQTLVKGPDGVEPLPVWNGDGVTVSNAIDPIVGKTMVVVTYTSSSVHTKKPMTTSIIQYGTGGIGYTCWNIINGYPNADDTRYAFLRRLGDIAPAGKRLMVMTGVEGMAVAEVIGLKIDQDTDPDVLDRIIHEVAVFLHTGR